MLKSHSLVAVVDSSFSINCGGMDQVSASNVYFYDDLETLGAATLYTISEHQWGVSNTGVFISNPNGPQYKANTESQIMGTLDSELYKTARISPSSLRYYGLGLKNGRYNIKLLFAEIILEDPKSWKSLGRRLFDIYIRGERVLQDFNIQDEVGGSKRAIVKISEANVINTIMEIHFFWARRGTCCIPFQGTYGPLVSAIHLYQGSNGFGSPSKQGKNRVGQLVGITVGLTAGALYSHPYSIYGRQRKHPGTCEYTLNRRGKNDARVSLSSSVATVKRYMTLKL